MKEELDRMAESYVQVEGSMVGSGSIVKNSSRNTWVLTCQHVVANDTVVSVVYREGERFKRLNARVAAVDTTYDLALLRTARRLPRPEIVLAQEEPELYTRGYVMGTAAALYGTAGEVLITAHKGSNGHKKSLQFSGIIVSGMSGGLLCNTDGELVGVLHEQEREGDHPLGNIGFAIPLPVVMAFLNAHLGGLP
jgi:S1-C subfamily serine protease